MPHSHKWPDLVRAICINKKTGFLILNAINRM